MNEKLLQKKIFRKFKFSLGLIGFVSSAILFHKYMCAHYPETIRKLYIDKLFNYNDTWQAENRRDNINFYYILTLYRTLLKFNFLPPVKLELDPKLKTELLGLKFNHPVGLGPGIDSNGKLLSNLNNLGFEFIEIGPVADDTDTDEVKLEYLLDSSKKNIIIKNFENLQSASHSVSFVQSQIYDILSNNQNTKLSVSTNLKLSNKSARSVPYMADSLFINMLKNALLLSDFTTINFSCYINSAILQYKNLKKFEIFLDKIKDEVYYEMGIKSIIDHEATIQPQENDIKVSDYFQYPIHLLSKGRTRILLRLDTKINDEELKNIINVIKNNKIVDGLVIGGVTNNTENYFICGERNKQISLDLLKKSYELTKGEISLISTGGVLNGDDVYERLKYGAEFVLIYSPFFIYGPYCLEKILGELKERMIKEEKNSIKEIRS